jgi:hypothetical protein
MVHDDWWCPRGGVDCSSRSSPFYMPRAPSCLTIIGLPRVRNHLSVGMRVAALHTRVAEELAALRVVVSSTVESVLGRSPDKTF